MMEQKKNIFEALGIFIINMRKIHRHSNTQKW